MSNLKHLTGIGQEFLITDAGDIIAEFVDGNFSPRVIVGDKEVTLSVVDDSCNCDTCFDSEKPCHSDCEAGTMCEGCKELYEYRKELEHEIDNAQGRF